MHLINAWNMERIKLINVLLAKSTYAYKNKKKNY